MVYVHLFGVFAFEPELPVRTTLGTSARRLASYLFAFPNELHRREKVVDLFWRDWESSKANSSLSTALWRIKQVCCDGPRSELTLQSGQSGIRLGLRDMNIVDTHRFHSTASNALARNSREVDIEALADAVELYTGVFLEEYDEDWVLHQRETLQSLYLRALTVLMRWNFQHQRYEDAINYGRRIVAFDPTRESVQRSLMLLYVLDGQRGEALRQFQRCETALREECDAIPMPETRALVPLMRSGDIAQKLPQLLEKELGGLSPVAY